MLITTHSYHMKRLILLAIALGLPGMLSAQVNITNIRADSDIPATMHCGDAFHLYYQANQNKCATAIQLADFWMDSWTHDLWMLCFGIGGTLQTNMNGYSPAQNQCNSNTFFGYNYTEQKGLVCACQSSTPSTTNTNIP